MRIPSQPVILAVLGGMMAIAFLHTSGKIDVGFGFPEGGIEEGALMAIIGGVFGYAVLSAFRLVRKLRNRDDG